MKDHLTRNPHRIDTFFTHTHTFLPWSADRHTHNELHWLCEWGQHMGFNWNVPWNVTT